MSSYQDDPARASIGERVIAADGARAGEARDGAGDAAASTAIGGVDAVQFHAENGQRRRRRRHHGHHLAHRTRSETGDRNEADMGGTVWLGNVTMQF